MALAAASVFREPLGFGGKLVLVAAAGAALPLSFAPFDWFVVAPVSLAVLFFGWSNVAPGRAFAIGLVYGVASFLCGTYWTFISVRGFGGAPIWLSVGATGGLVLILALFVAAAGWLVAKYWPGAGLPAWLGSMPAVWVLTEWCRGWLFTGFGWLSAGYSQTDSWLMSFAPLFGLHGMSYLVALTAGALLTLVFGSRRERRAALAAAVSIWLAAWLLDGHRFTEPKGSVVTVALVQGSVTQDIKWQPAQLPVTLDLYRDLTERSNGQQIVIWPEVAIPNLYEAVTDYLAAIRASAAAHGGTVVLGILKRDAESRSAQNAVVALTEPPQFYVKRHLVPFGEYFPVPGFARNWLRLLDLPYTDVAAGRADQPLLQVAGEQIAVTICYEDVFGSEQLGMLPDASLLVNVSNDAWFGDSIAPHQHLQIARVRAAEVGRYMLRSTNTGVTAIIDPQGRVVDRAEQFVPAVVRDSVQGFMGRTPYVFWGNYPVLVIAALVLVLQLPITKLTIRSGT
jgi:apolipoprotein N-acyltransferase